MWSYSYQTKTDVPIAQLWAVMADIENWHQWDSEVSYCKLHGKVAEGETFTLKPKAGPKVKVTIEAHVSPHTHVDLSHLPLGKMRFSHLFVPSGDKTLIKLKLEIWGVLGFLWRKVIGEPTAKNMGQQIETFIHRARTYQKV